MPSRMPMMETTTNISTKEYPPLLTVRLSFLDMHDPLDWRRRRDNGKPLCRRRDAFHSQGFSIACIKTGNAVSERIGQSQLLYAPRRHLNQSLSSKQSACITA